MKDEEKLTIKEGGKGHSRQGSSVEKGIWRREYDWQWCKVGVKGKMWAIGCQVSQTLPTKKGFQRGVM